MQHNKSRGKLDDTLAAMFSNQKYANSYLFYAHMIGQCSIKMDDNLPAPAGVSYEVDHYNLYINKNIFDEFTLHGRLAILKHEMQHILYGHIGRLGEREFKKWNYATDCAINQFIDKDHLPECAITPKTLGKMIGKTVPSNLSSEEYYDLIDDLSEENSSSEQGMDSHETWELSTGDEDLQKHVTKGMIETAQNETIKSNGKVPRQCSEWINIHTVKSQLNWKKVLRGIVGNKKTSRRNTIMRLDRRFPSREDLRGKVKDRTFDLLVVADVSGSMSHDALISTIGEVRHICDVTKTDVDLIQVDTFAHAPEKLSKKTKIFERKGTGGTYLSAALDKANEHGLNYNAVVVVTDGGLLSSDVSKFRALNKKVIWLIESNGYILDEMNEGKMQSFILK